MKKLAYGALILQLSAMPSMAYIYFNESGTWGAYNDDGEMVSDMQTEDNYNTIYNATELYTVGSSDVSLYIYNATEAITLNVLNGIDSTSYLIASSFTDLNIISTNSAGMGWGGREAVDASSGDNVTMLGGIYGTSRSDSGAVSMSSISDTVLLDDVSFYGDGEGNRSKAATVSIASTTLIIDNGSSDTYIEGSYGTEWTRTQIWTTSAGEYSSNMTGTSGDGGTALYFSGTYLYSTNANVYGGYARSNIWDDGELISYWTTLGDTDGDGGSGAEISSTYASLYYTYAEGGRGHIDEMTGIDQTGDFSAGGGSGLEISTSYASIESIEAYGGAGGAVRAYEGADLASATFTGGDAMVITAGTTTRTNVSVNGWFYGGTGGYAYAEGHLEDISMTGGDGITSSGNPITIESTYAYGGYAGTALVASNSYDVTMTGGNGGTGKFYVESGRFYGGGGGYVYIQGTNNSVTANGGNGLVTSGTSTIEDGIFKGGQGGKVLSTGSAEAIGGNGIAASSGTLTIYDGTFTGGKGGTVGANVTNSVENGGNGLYASGATVNLYGGTFKGGSKGTHAGTGYAASSAGYGVYALNTDLTVDGKDVLISDSMYFGVTSGSAELNLVEGTIRGDLDVVMSDGTVTTLSMEDDLISEINQYGGTLQAVLGSEKTGAYYDNVDVNSGTLSFLSNRFVSAKNADISLSGADSTLDFVQGAYLKSGTTIDAGLGTVTSSSGADIVMGGKSEISLHFKTSFDTNGVSSMSGGLISGNVVVSNKSAKIVAGGTAATYSGTYQIVNGTVDSGTYSLEEISDIDFGFLVNETLSDTSGLQVTLSYKSLKDTFDYIDSDYLTYFDDNIQNNLTEREFYTLNGAGIDGMAYSISQLPDTSESSFRANQQLNSQIAARGTEYRSMNGFASTASPNAGQAPQGVAGPEAEGEGTLQAWVRAYGGNGGRDASSTFSKYDSTTWGSVIGLDKSFGNLLVGLAGGYAQADLDSSSYSSETELYHGSLYATVGGESLFIDAAVTLGWGDNEEHSVMGDGTFDSRLYSAYIGAGYAFDLGSRFTITPEVSALFSYYEQDDYIRFEDMPISIGEYDTSSFLGSIGANISTQHQFDWLNGGLAFLPEVRAHYLREFNPDPDDVTFTANDVTTTFAVRSREENLFRLGVGFDTWSWKYQNAKLEIDYDALVSDSYNEHILSGKATWRF